MKIPRLLLPFLVILGIFGGYALRAAFIKPTTTTEFSGKGSHSVTCIVDGLKCKGTANFFTRLYAKTDGIASIQTFATEHKAVFRFDGSKLTADSIRAIMEAPIPLRDGTTQQVFVCQSIR
jgi:hypothetical protein